jgi:dihydrofolate synthase/folylpolyglutamate synthase
MDPLSYLLGLETLGIKFGLDNIRTLTTSLGDPHRAYATVHIAGTNGKGSTAAMVERALRAGGRRTGRYTSPHLTRLEERFVIDGAPVSEAELRDLAAFLRADIERLMARGELTTHPTFFEVTTAIAFELFRRRAIDIGVIEVGLGGRWDATNVVTPSVTAITSIALDHERLLGHSEQAIAREKAGIIKSGIPVVVGRVGEDATSVILDAARAAGAPVIRALQAVSVAATLDGDGRTILDLRTGRRSYGRLRLALRGRHQIDNAAVSVGVLEALEDRGFPLDMDDVRSGLEQVEWPGRLDLRSWPDGRRALFDAAHNPAGAAALADYLREFQPRGLPLVFAAMADKDWEGMLRNLKPFVRRLVVTRPDMRRAAAPQAIANGARALGIDPVTIVERPAEALEEAWRDGSLVAVAGSTFLVGELLPPAGRV